MDIDNHMTAGEIPEYATREETALERKERQDREWQRLAESDLLDMYLDLPLTGLSDRLIKDAIKRSINQNPERIQETFDKYCLKDWQQFTIMLDIDIRRHLDPAQVDFTAFMIANSIEVVLRQHIDKVVENMQ